MTVNCHVGLDMFTGKARSSEACTALCGHITKLNSGCISCTLHAGPSNRMWFSFKT
jgi:hypothetical protein